MVSGVRLLGLAEMRRQRGLSLEQIADSTKISTRFLRAIESEEFDKLPGGVFNTSYIRQYAAAIGVPEESVLSLYDAFETARIAEDKNQIRVRERLTLRWLSWLRGTSG
jgi:cytoskeletal protein RodZ